MLNNKDINQTLIRIPLINKTEEKKEIKVILEDCPGESIGAGDLADFIIGQIYDISFIRKSPFITNV